MHWHLPWMIGCLLVMMGSLVKAQIISSPYTILFSDGSSPDSMKGQRPTGATSSGEPDMPTVTANDWLKQQGWQQVWPVLGKHPLFFAGPRSQRFLRVEAENANFILTRELKLDPHTFPWLTITWGIERFPEAAAMDEYKRGDHAIAVIVSFGEKLPSSGLLPNIPRALAFFWGETEAVGGNYTCVAPRNGPTDVRMHCKYPHVKYIALRRGDAGRVHSDRVNLLQYFQELFPDYWQEHQKAAPVVGLSLEAATHQTQTASSARIYRLEFTSGEPTGSAVKTP